MNSRKRRWVGIRAAKALRRFIGDESYRSEALIRIASPRLLFQPYNFTLPDRYPELFRLARHLIGDGRDHRLLSFGCSTGEEVFALGQYFAEARIEGVDINRRNIAICRRSLARAPDSRIGFRLADSLTGCEPESYDAIFCMAVFRHGALSGGAWENCEKFIRFSDFDLAMTDIARCVKHGGLFFLEHSNFRFSDAAASAEFETIGAARRGTAACDGPIYDRHNRLVRGDIFREIAFRKFARENPRE